MGLLSSAQAAAPQTLHYKVQMKTGFGNAGFREFWIKGSNMRCELQSGQFVIAIVKNPNGVFMIHPMKKVAAKYPDGSPRGNARTLLPGPTGSPKAFLGQMKATRVASAKVGKQSCDVYWYTEPITKRHCKLWLDAKTGKPVKLWMEGKQKVMDEVTATYVTFVQGVAIPDSKFQVPKDYAIRPMPKQDYASRPASRQSNSVKPGT